MFICSCDSIFFIRMLSINELSLVFLRSIRVHRSHMSYKIKHDMKKKIPSSRTTTGRNQRIQPMSKWLNPLVWLDENEPRNQIRNLYRLCSNKYPSNQNKVATQHHLEPVFTTTKPPTNQNKSSHVHLFWTSNNPRPRLTNKLLCTPSLVDQKRRREQPPFCLGLFLGFLCWKVLWYSVIMR